MEKHKEKEVYKIQNKLYPCSTSITMDFIGGKWKTVILYYLKDGCKRYNELRKEMPMVTERTLSIQLKQLEADGVIKREVHTLKPPLKVEYALTDFGKTLIPLLEMVAQWGRTVAKEKAEIIKVS
ncbi:MULTISPECIES: winged helix-turn-helix transcriptional regulator [Flavobacterium]|uniref:Helix-turn-helix domain-containing protein n=1 Tax=Flavobacterium sedimenticola TaxID=3043286 RepID=A0ABT6XR32_9FLAO|nr:helix-turn-helix domain-containing protein [Flavobacterium sedimenticola]MDI9257549.1 helix-turn-helix domain-containing protein [Flavobacterium sedimenticola]